MLTHENFVWIPTNRELLEVVKTGAVDRATMIADGCTNYWSFLNSYYFAGTVVTTLGYGNVYPATNPGKVSLSRKKKHKFWFNQIYL